ncbi:MAG: endolytic transglycosylase MltG [Nocardioidaceae bacterium]|nr:endolytic transglycosylase MltG [Nocardioidaceae bacterium]
MSDIGLGFEPDDTPPPERRREPGSRRAEVSGGRRARGCLPMLLVLVVVLGGLWVGGGWAVDKVKGLVGENPDFSGPGTGQVVVEVHTGDTSAAIGRSLKQAGVVKSVGAFTDAAVADDRSRSIQVGFYQLKKEMKASDALAVLVNPKNLIQARVTVPEGYRVKDVTKAIVKHTDITAAQVRAALKNPAALGLPASAGGRIEGYLFPATYTVVPGETAQQLLKQMVAKTVAVTADLDLEARASALGYTPEQVLTLASILEYEGSRKEDLPKIARVFYNRLDDGMALQSDATVAYANNLAGTVWTTQAQRDNPSPYNTYVHTGLPPGPIGSPGERTIEAALNPAQGDWLFFVPINLETGETAFATTLAEHNANVAKLRAWCRETNSKNCD